MGHEFNAVKSGNYIALRNVVIEGMVFSEESESGLTKNAEQATAEKRMVNEQIVIEKKMKHILF